MTQHWASCSIVVCSLLALPQIVSARPAPRTTDPCKQLQHNLDRQIDEVKDRQKLERNGCELNHGRNSVDCLDLKDQQEQELLSLRADRAGQLNGCNGRPFSNRGTGLSGATDDHYPDQNNLYAQGYNHYCKHHHPHHPHHPYPHDDGKTAAGVGAKTPAAPGEKPKEKDAHNAGVNGTDHGAGSQTLGHASNHTGTSASGADHGSGHTGSASSTTNSNGGGHSGGGGGSSHSGSSNSGGSSHSSGGSSYSGSSNSGGSSHSSGGGSSYSGSSYSGGSSSSSSTSSSASQNTGGGHPK